MRLDTHDLLSSKVLLWEKLRTTVQVQIHAQFVAKKFNSRATNLFDFACLQLYVTFVFSKFDTLLITQPMLMSPRTSDARSSWRAVLTLFQKGRDLEALLIP